MGWVGGGGGLVVGREGSARKDGRAVVIVEEGEEGGCEVWCGCRPFGLAGSVWLTLVN